MLTVSPALQNSGIGKQLLQAAEAYARTQQCTSVVMSVISVRHELIQWYERHGYKKTGATKPFPADDRRFGIPKQFLEFSIMEKPLQ
jgi:ribosomal protein S18 acetylase RimI-like enzyme